MGLAKFDITTEIEIELTNRCNAACVACPRDDMPPFGLMSEDTLERILDLYETPASTATIARRVTLAGGGDPLIHPRAPALIGQIASRGFAVHLITNAFAATAPRAELLVASGLSSIAVSFWGIELDEYERAMRLPYRRTLENVERLADLARQAGIPLTVTWVRGPGVTSSDEAIARFWTDRRIEVDLTDNAMWNRGGLLPIGPTEPTETLLLPDPSRHVWCADLALSDAWTWDGTCVMCCCSYFASTRTVLGNVDRDDFASLKRRKRDLLEARPLPAMCQGCLQPRRTQAAWLAEPIRRQLSAKEWDALTYRSTTEA